MYRFCVNIFFLYIFNSLSEYLGVGLLDSIITMYVYNTYIPYC